MKGTATPLVSVIVPTYNRPESLPEALASIQAQSYENREIIVVNDGGGDVSEIISRYNHDGRIIYIQCDESSGPAAARNTGLRNARGKYIAYLDDDDIFYPEHIETLVGFLERNGNKVAYSDAYQAFQKIEEGKYVTTDKRVAYSIDFDKRRLLVMNYIPTLNIIHDRECIDEAGLFDETLETQEDWDLWIRMSRKYDFHHIKSVTAEFRTRLNSSSLTSSKRSDFLHTMKIIHLKYSDPAKDPDIIEQQKCVESELEKEIAFKAKLALEPGSFSVAEARTGRPSMRVRTRDGILKTLHSMYDPEAEARNMVDAFRFDGRGIIVVLGLGLGYHVSELAGRYPDTEIIVIEAYPEVYELAAGHALKFRGNVKLLIDHHPDRVLREITSQQMKGGLSPLSVFTLSSAVSAFPDYYRPILDALNKTVSVKLWDRLRYVKFKQDKHKVLFIDTGYFLVREAEQALRSLGHGVLRVPIGTEGEGRPVISRFVEAIVNFKPDFLLTMNHLGFDEDGVLTDFFRSIEMPVASWYVDSPNLIVQAFDKNVSPWMSLFLWDKSYMKDMESMGFESVMHMPLATDEGLFKPMKTGKHNKILSNYTCDVGFVGNSMVDPVNDWMAKVDPAFHPMIEKSAEHVALPGNRHGDIMSVMPEMERERLERLTNKERMNIEAAVIWKATLLYRLSLIKELEGFDTAIHGDQGWQSLLNDSNIRLGPPLNYYKELPSFYNSCKINFNATSRQMREAVNQRVFDVPACGSFILTDYQESLEGLFEVGKEIIVYKSKDEIRSLVKYYLDNSCEREAVARRGRERVLKEHTYKHRLEMIINKMRGRYS